MHVQCSSCRVEFETSPVEGAGTPPLCDLCRNGSEMTDLFKFAKRSPGTGPEPAVPETAPEVLAAAANPANRIGRYVRVRLIAKGGMAEVWRAWDLDLGRWVAVKFPRLDSDLDVERMRREASAAGRISHPAVAAVYEFGQANGRPFIAMQYIDGTTLAAHPKEDKRKLVAFVRDAALGVASAHAHGVVHRDLTPSNLMVDREGIHAYVMDFGIARPSTSTRTSTTIAGTPAYMAPEQARGDRVDERSDVYSLGATLYDLLAGNPPFDGTTPVATLKKVEHDDAKPILGIDADLNTIVLKCLEKDPARRYPTAMELATDLSRWLNGEPVSARRPTLTYRARKFVSRRRRFVVAIGVTTLAMLVALVWVYADRMARISQIRRTRRVQERLARANEALREARAYFYVPDCDIREKISGVEPALAELETFMADPEYSRETAGWVLLGSGWHLLGDLAKSEDRLKRAVALDASHLEANLLLAAIYVERGSLDQARACFERLAGRTLDAVATARHALARGDRAEVLRLCDEGLANSRSSPGTEEYWVLRALVSEGDERIACLEKAVRRRPHYAWAWFKLGECRPGVADLEKALEAAPPRWCWRPAVEELLAKRRGG